MQKIFCKSEVSQSLIKGIDKVIHGPNSISPGPIENVKRPWYMHTHQDDNLMVLLGTRFVDIYDVKTKTKASISSNKIKKINKNTKTNKSKASQDTKVTKITKLNVSNRTRVTKLACKQQFLKQTLHTHI